ncbi:hypothetical protein OUZ56_002710 [Daphnia magna]|uniref:Uncharacterized protein n=1 Tax=Daphnia magna TaxID=35525 RepID=A0ABR0A6K7_9CRUS|nr:hypothetical protein OUZ56_002710 [Daphnia magna]
MYNESGCGGPARYYGSTISLPTLWLERVVLLSKLEMEWFLSSVFITSHVNKWLLIVSRYLPDSICLKNYGQLSC